VQSHDAEALRSAGHAVAAVAAYGAHTARGGHAEPHADTESNTNTHAQAQAANPDAEPQPCPMQTQSRPSASKQNNNACHKYIRVGTWEG
jgi:hypothetical protein